MDVIIVAAGSGRRMGNEIPKQFMLIDDKPVIYYSILPFEKNKNVDNIFVVISEDSVSLYNSLCEKYLKSFTKLRHFTIGGKLRQDSVFNGLEAVRKNGNCNVVAIHDAARPFLTQNILNKLFETALLYGGAAPGITVTDTVKETDLNGFITTHLVREKLRAVQTPQVFNFMQIYNAYVNAFENKMTVTDDTEIFTKTNGKTMIIEGDVNLFKITYASDMEKALCIVKSGNFGE